jgi:putative ABC transport system permease protein
MVGVGVVTLFTVFAASLKQSVSDSVAGSVKGDLVITAGNFGGGGLSPQLATDIARLDEVDGAVGLGIGAALVDGDSEFVAVVDPAAAFGVLDLDVVDGSIDRLPNDALAVSTTIADDNEWAVGSPVTFTFGDGSTEELRVGATYDARDVAGDYLLPRAVWDAHNAQPVDAIVLAALDDGVPLETGRDAVQRVADRYGAPDVQDRDEYVDSAAGQIDQVLGLVYVMLALAIVIALMGIANTLALAVYERTSELGILRAVGTTRRQLRAMVRSEAAIISVFGTLAGIAVGVFLGWGLVRVAGAAGGFDGFAVPGGQLAVIVVVGALAGIVAGLRPARRAAKLDVLQAVATV